MKSRIYDSADPNLPKKVVTDRYRKRIKEEDANRAEANYAKSAAAGALAGLALRLKNSPPRHRALVGAGAGLAAEAIVRALGKTSVDYYGERDRLTKKSEKVPALAGLGVAGTLGYRRLRKKAFESGSRGKFLIRKAGTQEKEFAISPKLKARLITAAALAGGITVADAATSAAFPVDEEARKQAALHGVKRGALYGGVLAASEPGIRSLLQRSRKFFEDRRARVEFRANDAADVQKQRRSLASYAGAGLAGAAGLALLLKRHGGSRAIKSTITSTSRSLKPVGRGTEQRIAAANALRGERGYVHLRPMTPGQRKRFDKLPTATQAHVAKFGGLARSPNLSPEERRKFRQAIGRLRGEHHFNTRAPARNRARNRIELSAFIKDVAFKALPVETRKEIRAFAQVKPDTMLAHYGMVAKELAHKADPHNLSSARKHVGKMSRKAAAEEVHRRRATKHILVNNDRIVDGHHFLAKAERGRVSGSLHVIDLTPSRFQMGRRGKVNEFLSGPMPAAGDQPLPPWVQARRKNKKRREQIHNIERGVGAAAGLAGIGTFIHRILEKKRAARGAVKLFAQPDVRRVGLEEILAHLRRVHQARQAAAKAVPRLGYAEAEERLRQKLKPGRLAPTGFAARPRRVIEFREQLRNQDDDRFANVYAASLGLSPTYYRKGNARVDVSDLPVAHAQVLRKVFRDAGKVRRTGGRVSSLLRDTGDVVAGNPRRRDYAGRPQKREWEKSWFKKAATDAAIGAAGVGALLHLKNNPAHRDYLVGKLRKARSKANSFVPDFYAGRGAIRKAGTREISLARPIPSGAAAREYLAKLRAPQKSLRELLAAQRAAQKMKPKGWYPERGLYLARGERGGRLVRFDEWADLAGWDVRDPRGRSARVFAPGSRKRIRRQKEWHEREDNRRKIRAVLAGVVAAGAGGAGYLVGKKTRKMPLPISPKSSASWRSAFGLI